MPKDSTDSPVIAPPTDIVRPFAHLHCHTHYSLLDGANKVPDLIKQVKSLGMNACAITDHGNLYGALEFYQTCRKHDVNPILGYEAYIAPGSRKDKSAGRMKEASFHLTLLAMNAQGFQNLVAMASSAFTEGFYYKPRIDKELLERYHEGLICLSGCASSELSRQLLAGETAKGEATVAWFQKLFGDRYYLEIQNGHIDIQTDSSSAISDLGNKMGLPLVATNDAHYLCAGDAEAHDVLLCVNTKRTRDDENRMRIDTDQLFLRSPDQMYDAFAGQEDAVARSQEIADRCDMQWDLNAKHYPVFDLPPGVTDTKALRELCFERLPERYGPEPEQKYVDRLELELGIIDQMGYSSYFLIVEDFVRYAVGLGIPCTARGSACGSIVAYLLRFSDVCPIKYDLLFERFLDASRTEPPDIDIDFCRDRREVVIQYVKDKYGHDSVAQIGTFGTLKAKAAVRDVARALAIPLGRADEIAKMVPDILGIKLEEAIKKNPELQQAYDQDSQARELLDFAMKLEGLAKSVGTHAAGVVVADAPLANYIPLQKLAGKEDILTQWTGPDVETVGILKFDFLGLRNLSILDKSVQNVKKRHGIDVVPRDFPLDDEPTYALLQRGETKGIFQFESGGIRDLLTKMKPDRFADIIATSALYRPGPLEGGMVMTYVNVKHGREPVPKVHPIVDGVLDETYGVMVYQEQVMRILNRLGGIELAGAYRCIKAISKKKESIIASFHDEFIEGAGKHDMSPEQAQGIWDLIVKFAGYGFNKSHSTAYGAVSYQTAYLKAHYPAEFMAALLSCGMESHERMSEHSEDARRAGCQVLPPCVNESDVEFKVVDDMVISYGLGAIKGVGETAMHALVDEREASGPYESLFDLCERVDPKLLTKNNIEVLVKAGALDTFEPNRARHMLAIDRAVQAANAAHRDKASGQMGLFGGGDSAAAAPAEQVEAVLPVADDWPESQRLAFEKEAFGFYLTSHPLAEYAADIEQLARHTTADLRAMDDGAEVVVGGMVSAIKMATTKKPSRNGASRYANFDFEDAAGCVRCICWPDTYSQMPELIKADTVLIIRGRIDARGREPNLIVNKAMTVEKAEKEFAQQLCIKLQEGYNTSDEITSVRNILRRNPGKTPVAIVVESSPPKRDEKLKTVITLPPTATVSCSREMRTELRDVLGAGSVHLQMNGHA